MLMCMVLSHMSIGLIPEWFGLVIGALEAGARTLPSVLSAGECRPSWPGG